MRWLKLTIAYDGTAYAGWQVQSGPVSIQQKLEEAMQRVTGESIRITASGRTDAGVHACGQVAGLATATHLTNDTLRRALCAELPWDIAVLAVEDAREGFDPIRDAVRKRYRYQILDGPVRDVFRRNYAWYFPTRLNAEAMHRAAQRLLGRHDFSSFESSGAPRASSVRTVNEIFVRRGAGQAVDDVTLEVEADGFLYNMVRAIVGTLVEVGRGVKSEDWPGEVLAACHRKQAGQTAPARGLCLVSVHYE